MEMDMLQPERDLRTFWTDQGLSKERQDELISQICAKAAPGSKVGPFTVPNKGRFEIATYKSAGEVQKGIAEESFYSDDKKEVATIKCRELKRGMWVEVFDGGELIDVGNPN